MYRWRSCQQTFLFSCCCCWFFFFSRIYFFFYSFHTHTHIYHISLLPSTFPFSHLAFSVCYKMRMSESQFNLYHQNDAISYWNWNSKRTKHIKNIEHGQIESNIINYYYSFFFCCYCWSPSRSHKNIQKPTK